MFAAIRESNFAPMAMSLTLLETTTSPAPLILITRSAMCTAKTTHTPGASAFRVPFDAKEHISTPSVADRRSVLNRYDITCDLIGSAVAASISRQRFFVRGAVAGLAKMVRIILKIKRFRFLFHHCADEPTLKTFVPGFTMTSARRLTSTLTSSSSIEISNNRTT